MQLRDDQLSVVAAALTNLRRGRRSLLLVAPTGWGKTPVLCAILSAFMESAPSRMRILWCAHRDRLLRQAFDAAHAIAPHLITRLTLLNSASRHFCAADVLVIDEAHRDATRTNQRIRQEASPQIIIGATATPDRQDRSGLNFDAVLTVPSTDQLIEAGILSTCEHFALDAPARMEHLVTAVLAEPARWGKSLVFVATMEEAHRAIGRLRTAGVRAAPALGDGMKEAAVSAFLAGRIDVLVSCHALTEGIDLPSVQSVFLRDSLTAPTWQAIGRALRRHGTKVANIVQFASAKAPFVAAASPRRRWLGSPAGGWMELPTKPLWPAQVEATKAQIGDLVRSSPKDRLP